MPPPLTGLWIGQDQSDNVIDALFRIAPEHVALTLEPVVDEVLSNKSSEILTVSALFAIWVASNAVEAIRVAFDRAYEVRKPRGLFCQPRQGLHHGICRRACRGAAGIFDLCSAPLILNLAQNMAGLRIPIVAGYLTYGFGVLVFVGFAFILHWFLPGRSMKKIRIWPGILVTTLFWVIAAGAFSTYLTYTPTYTVTYGTLAGVIITLMFFYITGATIIFGAEFNAALARSEQDPDAGVDVGIELRMAVGVRKRRRIQLVHDRSGHARAAATALIGYGMRDGIEFFPQPRADHRRPAPGG